jgi:selenocysteine lyase/cysteine desulfurase
MGVLYGKYELLDKLMAYRVSPAPQDPPGKFETGTGNFEGICGVLRALEYIEWVGDTFGAEHTERYAGEYQGRRLTFKLGMSAIRSYEFELSRSLLDILAETPGVTVYGIKDRKRLEQRVPTCAFTLKGKSPRQVAEQLDEANIYVWEGTITPWPSPSAWGLRIPAACCAPDLFIMERWNRYGYLGKRRRKQ